MAGKSSGSESESEEPKKTLLFPDEAVGSPKALSIPKLKKPVLKRPPPPSEEAKKKKDSKKTKLGDKEVKKSTIQVWGDEDTVALMELFLAFRDEKGADPCADGGIVFHDYVKGKLSFETSTSKLMDKIRRLKKKFLDMAKDPIFIKPIFKKIWILSKKIWGNAGGDEAVVEKNDEAVVEKNDEAVVEKNDEAVDVLPKITISKLYPYLCKSLKDGHAHMNLVSKDCADSLEKSLFHLEKSKLEELEDKWKKQILHEMESSLGRAPILLHHVGMLKDLYLKRG